MKTKNFLIPVAAVGLTLTLGGAAHADVIAGYDFDGPGGTPTAAATSSDASVTASSITPGTGLGAGSNPPFTISSTENDGNLAGGTNFGAGGNNFAQAEFPANGLSGAITANDFFELTITPDAGVELDFTDVTFRAAATGSSANRRFSVLFMLASDAGFTDAGASANLAQSIVNTGVTLSDDAGLQDVDEAVTFRFYGYSNGSGRDLGIDDIVFNGDITVIPEPASLALLGLGGLMLLPRRKRA